MGAVAGEGAAQGLDLGFVAIGVCPCKAHTHKHTHRSVVEMMIITNIHAGGVVARCLAGCNGNPSPQMTRSWLL